MFAERPVVTGTQSPQRNEFHVIAARRSLPAAAATLVGASVIATSAIAPVEVAVPRLSDAAVSLQASVLDIFTFPAAQQAIVNEVEYAALWAAGLAESGIGIGQSLAAVLPTLITATQQIFARDPLGALTTVEDAAVGAAEAILIPLVASRIDIGQIQLAVQSALLLAQPVAAVELGAGLFAALDAVTRAVITAGQNFVDAVLSLNLGNIVTATVDGVRDVVASFATAGQDAVDSIVAAQTTLATALAVRPAPIPVAAVPSSAAAYARTPVAAASVVAAEAVAADAVTADLGATARESATEGAAASESAPRRAVGRSVASDGTEAAAADAAAPTKERPAPRRAARAVAAS
jgi:hypothetical protein